MSRMKEISEYVAGDQLYVEKYIKELSDVRMGGAIGAMVE